MIIKSYLILSPASFLFSFIFIFGTWKNWKFFTDPHEDFWLMWFQHAIRKYGGVEVLKLSNYLIGFLFLLNGLSFISMYLENNF